MINDRPGEDPTSQAILVVNGQEAALQKGVAGQSQVIGISGFSVSIDILQMGDPFSLTVPNPRGKWNEKLKPGAAIQLKLSNPNVNGGTPTLIHTGRIVGRVRSSENGKGSVMQLQCADLGWHLMTHYPTPHIRLEEATYERLLAWAINEPTWGIKGVTADTATSRLIRLGLSGGRASAEAAASDQLIIFQAQTEPGQSLGDLLLSYARRFNRLVNMSPDGYIQVFRPNDTQPATYRIDLHEFDDPDVVRNNVLEASISDDIGQQWTKVTVVGQVVGYQVYDKWNYNPGKFLGVAEAQGDNLLDFKHEFTYSDGEVYDPRWGEDGASWRLRRDLFDCWTATYRVRGHWQKMGNQSRWWIPDTMCEVNDSVHGIRGTYYVSAVKLERTAQGDTTEVTLRRPYLLSANFRNVVSQLVQ